MHGRMVCCLFELITDCQKKICKPEYPSVL